LKILTAAMETEGRQSKGGVFREIFDLLKDILTAESEIAGDFGCILTRLGGEEISLGGGSVELVNRPASHVSAPRNSVGPLRVASLKPSRPLTQYRPPIIVESSRAPPVVTSYATVGGYKAPVFSSAPMADFRSPAMRSRNIMMSPPMPSRSINFPQGLRVSSPSQVSQSLSFSPAPRFF
jgi:hypothetical protein